MPDKRSPITSERLSCLARGVRGNALVALENVALWHERDISHSSAERIILPDSCMLLDYMLTKLRDVVEKLQIYPERMQQNLDLTKGLYFSQSILLALTSAGAERKTAYEAVQRAAMKTWKGKGTFAENAKTIADTRDAGQYFASNHLNEVKVRFYGDTAIAQGDETWERRNSERGRFVWTDTWIRRNGRWQIVAAEDLVAPESPR